jgi:hypothetical protein
VAARVRLYGSERQGLGLAPSRSAPGRDFLTRLALLATLPRGEGNQSRRLRIAWDKRSIRVTAAMITMMIADRWW